MGGRIEEAQLDEGVVPVRVHLGGRLKGTRGLHGVTGLEVQPPLEEVGLIQPVIHLQGGVDPLERGVVRPEQHVHLGQGKQGRGELVVHPQGAFPFAHGSFEIADAEPELTQSLPGLESGGIGLNDEDEIIHRLAEFATAQVEGGPVRISIRIHRGLEDACVEPGQGVLNDGPRLRVRSRGATSRAEGQDCEQSDLESGHQASACSTVSAATSALRAALIPVSSSSMSSGLSSSRFLTASRPWPRRVSP